MNGPDVRLADFEAVRPTLFGVAYQLLGSVSDAEDAVQETWVRYATASVEPDSLQAYLCTIVTRICLDVLRSARVRRERYVGPWFPEPLPTETTPVTLWGHGGLSPEQAVDLADTVSMAALLLLERLSPPERAVFVLRDVFGFEYGQVAEILGRTETTCRQLGSRARRRVEAGRPRFEADRRKHSELADKFFAALQEGDVEALQSFLAADVAALNDGGGVAGGTGGTYGAARAAHLLVSTLPPLLSLGAELEQIELNGQPGALVRDRAGAILAAWVLDIADGQVQTIRSVTNPAKLAHLGPTGDVIAASRERNRARRPDKARPDLTSRAPAGTNPQLW